MIIKNPKQGGNQLAIYKRGFEMGTTENLSSFLRQKAGNGFSSLSYPRRLESLTVCRCHCKGSTFSSVILKTLSFGPAGVWTRDSRSADRRSPNWVN